MLTEPLSIPTRRCDGSTTVSLRILATSDVHGHVTPFDYVTRRPDPEQGLARLATVIGRARDEAGDGHSLLLDNGDFLQGTALTDLTARPGGDWDGCHPVIDAMNQLGYDAGTLGNHEFNFGLDWLERTLDEAGFPVLCANAVRARGKTPLQDTPFRPPYTILRRWLSDGDGTAHEVAIGVIGLTPPQVATWDHAHLDGQIELRDMVETARTWIPAIRAEGADLVVALAHTGIETGSDPDTPMVENAARALARLEGLDVLITGHNHRCFPGSDNAGTPGADIFRGTLEGTPCVNPGYGAAHLGQIDLQLARVADGWRIESHHVTLEPARGASPCGRMERTLEPAHSHTVRLTERLVGETRAPLHSYLTLARDDPGLALINAAQTAALADVLAGTEHADLPVLSATAAFRTGGRAGPDHFTDIAAGPLRLCNLADLYGFPNTLCGLVVTGAELRDWLERAAICFNRIEPGVADQPLLNPSVPGHVFDVIAGLSYTLDPSQPARYALSGALVAPDAQRVRDLSCRGRPVRDTDRFAVAVNSYRAWGGAPFAPLAESGLIYRSDREIRDILAEHVSRSGPLEPEAQGTWRFAAMPKPTSAVLHTGPGLRAHPDDIAAVRGMDRGIDAAGFLNLRVPFDDAPGLANPQNVHYVRFREVGAGKHLANPVRSGRKQP